MEKVNSRQLAFLLEIPLAQAKDKIAFAYCMDTDQPPHRDNIEFYPNSVEIDVFEKHCGIKIRQAIEDIRNNYLNRHVTRGYILDYPRKFVDYAHDAPKKMVRIPPGLRSILPKKIQGEIIHGWHERYSNTNLIFPE
jgi:hypothetical protein